MHPQRPSSLRCVIGAYVSVWYCLSLPSDTEVEMVTYVAQDVAQLMDLPFADVCEATTRNARAFFSLQ